MEKLASLFAGKAQNVLVVSVAFLVGNLVPSFTALGMGRQLRTLLIVLVAWGLNASWEWLVHFKTPQANIRVDLLVIWPVLAILSMWALFRVVR